MTTAADGCIALSKVIKIPIGIRSIAESKKARVIRVGSLHDKKFRIARHLNTIRIRVRQVHVRPSSGGTGRAHPGNEDS